MYKPDCDSHTHSKPNRHAPAIDGEWIGTAAKPDGSTASVILNFDEVSPELTIEPLIRKWKLALKQEGERISLSTEGRTLDPFKKIEFSGTAENGSITGNITWDGHASQTYFIQLDLCDRGNSCRIRRCLSF
ncbi:MAG: hypothetical protein IPO36_14675 [Anaerolineales bacterium]|nr:hypothetical protein [Anaerolineales bacterium]